MNAPRQRSSSTRHPRYLDMTCWLCVPKVQLRQWPFCTVHQIRSSSTSQLPSF